MPSPASLLSRKPKTSGGAGKRDVTDVPRAMACDGIIPRASEQHAWVQVAYSLLAVSPDRHLEYIRCMTGSEPLANGTGLRLSDWMLGP